MHPSLQRIFDDVAKFGWHVVGVNPVSSGPEFSFTVGLFESFRHPELVVFGLPFPVAQGLFTTCVERIRQGELFANGQVRSDLLNRHRVAVMPVEVSFYPKYLGSAIGFYADTTFPALQLVWPDKGDRFPWQPGYDPAYSSAQVLLSTPVA